MISRRQFLKAGVAGAGIAVGTPGLGLAPFARAAPGDGPYGPLLAADANGIMLPAGFSSRVVAVSGQAVAGTGYTWHPAPDGGAAFPVDGGGWVYTSNSEVPSFGGAGALRFATDGALVAAHRILGGTSVNCAGGPTPWGTWLSCEEFSTGQVWECDPLGVKPARALPAMGRFQHEAAAVDPLRRRVYLTEDRDDGRLYRFTPANWPDLAAGPLEVAVASGTAVSWQVVPDPSAASVPTRQQVAGSTAFRGGEGAWYADDRLWFTTKGDDRVWQLDLASSTLSVIYDAATSPTPILTGVDNIVRSSAGDLFVAEDPGNLELVLIAPSGVLSPFLRVVGQDGSELTGPAFDPSGSRLYFSSQRGPSGSGLGVTYEVTGPFRRPPTMNVDGFTWFSDGSSHREGPIGTVINAYSTGARRKVAYRLVTSSANQPPDVAAGHDVVAVSPTTRLASNSGLIGGTAGPVYRSPGLWHVCFRALDGTSITAPVTFRVTG